MIRRFVYLFVFCSCSLNAYPTAVPPITDTLPGTITVMDTVVIFDFDTYKETVNVVRSEYSLEEYINQTSHSGKEFTIVDTLSAFDYDRYEQKTFVRKVSLPSAFKRLLPTLTPVQKYALYKRYNNAPDYTVSKNSSLLFITIRPEDHSLRILDQKGNPVLGPVPLQKNNGMIGTTLASLNLTSGKYIFVLEPGGSFWPIDLK